MGALTAEQREAAETRRSVDEAILMEHISASVYQPVQGATGMFLFGAETLIYPRREDTGIPSTFHASLQLEPGCWATCNYLYLSDIRKTYSSASHDTQWNMRQSIPECFTCSVFSKNSSNLEFGISQTTRERIHNLRNKLTFERYQQIC